MWVVNMFMLLMWFFNPSVYQEFKAQGYPCYAWVGGGTPTSPEPACFYDPTGNQ